MRIIFTLHEKDNHRNADNGSKPALILLYHPLA